MNWKMTVQCVLSQELTTPYLQINSSSQLICASAMDQEVQLVNGVQMTKWALSFAICGEVSTSLNDMTNANFLVGMHKKAKRQAD